MQLRSQATLWLLDLAAIDDATLALGLASLGASVQQRYRRFRRAERRKQFLAGRLLLRQALGAASGAGLADIHFIERSGAPPQTVLPGVTPFFSISHAGHWVACAVGTAAPLGLDIELSGRQRDFSALAAHSFDPATARRIASLPQPRRAPAFYRAWCRLEARFKLGEPARHWRHPSHAELEIALCSPQPFDLSMVRCAELDAHQQAFAASPAVQLHGGLVQQGDIAHDGQAEA